MLVKSAVVVSAAGGSSRSSARRDVMKDLRPHFDDALHHRFMDREMVQRLVNKYSRYTAK